jgi:hypothetical protein
MPDDFVFLNQSRIVSTNFRISPQYQISRESVQWDLRWCMLMDGLTDIMKLIEAFGDYAKAPKM